MEAATKIHFPTAGFCQRQCRAESLLIAMVHAGEEKPGHAHAPKNDAPPPGGDAAGREAGGAQCFKAGRVVPVSDRRRCNEKGRNGPRMAPERPCLPGPRKWKRLQPVATRTNAK